LHPKQHKQHLTHAVQTLAKGTLMHRLLPMHRPCYQAQQTHTVVHLQEVDDVVERLHSAARSKEGKVEAALGFKQYQELKACTFTPEITRGVPKQTVRTDGCSSCRYVSTAGCR
jgi:gamma-glutamyl-gamma-aminobutyrate hydrolase PuuD